MYLKSIFTYVLLLPRWVAVMVLVIPPMYVQRMQNSTSICSIGSYVMMAARPGYEFERTLNPQGHLARPPRL